MRARVALAVLVLAAAGLAGCLAHTSPSPVVPADEDGTPQATNDATPSTPGPTPAAPAAPGTPYVLDAPGSHDTVVRNGSFTYYQSFYPAGWAAGTYEDGIDLTGKIPVGVPAEINVTLEYDQEIVNYVGLDLVADGAEVYDHQVVTSFSDQTVWLEATVARHDDDARVVVEAEGYYPDDGTSEYTMRAQVAAHPDLVTPRVPTEINVPSEAQGFRLGFEGADGAFQATVWDPLDRLVGHYRVHHGPGEPDNVTVELGPEHPPGRYVVLVHDVELAPSHSHPDAPHHHHGVYARTLAPTPHAEVDPLELRYTWGGNRTAGHGETVGWRPTVPTAPIQAGLVATPTSQPFTANPATLSGHLRSPSGSVVAFDGNGFLLGFGGYSWLSPAGLETLDDGTYRASFTNGGGTPLTVTHVAAFYQR